MLFVPPYRLYHLQNFCYKSFLRKSKTDVHQYIGHKQVSFFSFYRKYFAIMLHIQNRLFSYKIRMVIIPYKQCQEKNLDFILDLNVLICYSSHIYFFSIFLIVTTLPRSVPAVFDQGSMQVPIVVQEHDSFLTSFSYLTEIYWVKLFYFYLMKFYKFYSILLTFQAQKFLFSFCFWYLSCIQYCARH